MSGYKLPTTGKTLRFKRDRYLKLTANKGWTTQAEQARGIGISQQTVSRILNHQNWTPDIPTLAALLSALSVDLHDLFEIVPAPTDASMRQAS